VLPILESSGLVVGRDVYLAFVPERVDPGRRDYTIHNTPVVVGGVDAESTRRAMLLFEQLATKVMAVSSPAAAEMAKLLENVFRNVNIALVNQLAMLCDRMGLDIWEIVDAAATKPYGFLPFLPGPGIGGHCIPVDPYYLAWKAREYDYHMDFIELAARVNEEMPYHVVTKILLALNGQRTRQPGVRVMVLGVTFKRDIDDYRGSPALKIMELLMHHGARVSYHDPYVPKLPVDGRVFSSRPLTPAALRAADCVLIVADHSAVDYESVVRHAKLVVDTRYATKAVKEGRVKIVKL
jgi:UDP-N-acetyl-D-glucosamine dehydrogenase